MLGDALGRCFGLGTCGVFLDHRPVMLFLHPGNLSQVFNLQFLISILVDLIPADKTILIFISYLDVKHLVELFFTFFL